MLKTTLSFLRAHLGRIVDQVEQRGDRIIIERNGRPVAALVMYSDYIALEEAAKNSPDYIAWKQRRELGKFSDLYAAMRVAEKAHPTPKPAQSGDGDLIRDEFLAR